MYLCLTQIGKLKKCVLFHKSILVLYLKYRFALIIFLKYFLDSYKIILNFKVIQKERHQFKGGVKNRLKL